MVGVGGRAPGEGIPAPASTSQEPDGYLTIQLNSDIVYMEIISDPTG